MGNQPAESQVKVRNPWPKPVVPVERTTGLEPATLTLAKKKVIAPVRSVPPSRLTWCSVHGFVHPVVLNPCRSGLVYYEARSSRRNRVRLSWPIDSSRPLSMIPGWPTPTPRWRVWQPAPVPT